MLQSSKGCCSYPFRSFHAECVLKSWTTRCHNQNLHLCWRARRQPCLHRRVAEESHHERVHGNCTWWHVARIRMLVPCKRVTSNATSILDMEPFIPLWSRWPICGIDQQMSYGHPCLSNIGLYARYGEKLSKINIKINCLPSHCGSEHVLNHVCCTTLGKGSMCHVAKSPCRRLK